ncbi:DUF5710 domain-containing protein [Deltaproteobacteria bacterium OttesenSCG-928-K17]|nr:DUF5710 domain-containing protein [Deltaproteobacteria bacterium OttesenSCG-928-K17]
MSNDSKPNHRKEIINRFLDGLQNGDSPFAYPFASGEIQPPVNGVSGKTYSSVNRLILSQRGGTDPRWLTKRQMDELGYQPKEAAQTQRLVFWDFYKETPALNQDGSPRLNNIGNQIMEKVRRDRPAMRFYEVYNARDLLTQDGRELPSYEAPAPEKSSIERATDILANSGAVISHRPSVNAANYKMSSDTIILPDPGLVSEEEYYSQAIEELVSWTGHPDRLGWLVDQKTESQQVQGSLQETLSKAMVAQDLGFPVSQTLASPLTLKTWARTLEKDPDMLFRAATQADNIRLYVMSQERGLDHELGEDAARPSRSAYYSQSFRPAGPDEQEKSGPWIPVIDEQEATVFAVLSSRDQFVVSTFDNREASVAEADRLNLGAKPSLKYSGDIIVLEVPYEEKDMVKSLGATWDRKSGSWCARPGVELNKLSRWIPAPELNRPGLIEPDANERITLDVPYKQRQEAKDLGAFFDSQQGAWLTSVNNKNLAELTKKFPPVQENGLALDLAETAAVPEIATERVVLDVPFEEKNQAKAAGAKWDRDNKVWVADPGTDLTRLGQWIPEKEPEPEKVLAATEEFAKVLEKSGFQLDGPPVMNGSIQRVAIAGGKPNARDGAYYATLKGEQPSGWLKNHKTGEYQAWISSGQEMTAAGKKSQKANETAKRQSKREMAEMAAMIKWESSQDVTEEFASQIDGMTSTSDLLKNPFLEVAGVNAMGGVRRDDDGNLLVPAVNSEGKLLTIQTISPNGEAHFEKNCLRSGAMCLIDSHDLISTRDQQTGLPVFRDKYADYVEANERDILIAEDYATGASLSMATSLPVAVALSPDNLPSVAKTIKAKYPEASILVCANNNPERYSNLSLKAAEEAARKVGGKVVVPEFTEMEIKAGLATFNDVHKTLGLEAVSKTVNQVRQQGQANNTGLSR